MIIAIICLIIALFIITAFLMESKFEKDRNLYACYIRMNYKGIASGSCCEGDNKPECKKCYYHKMFLEREK